MDTEKKRPHAKLDGLYNNVSYVVLLHHLTAEEKKN